MAPSWALYPRVALATLATLSASQAFISGAFSKTMQGEPANALEPPGRQGGSESGWAEVLVPK